MNNQPTDRQSDETRLTSELDKILLPYFGAWKNEAIHFILQQMLTIYAMEYADKLTGEIVDYYHGWKVRKTIDIDSLRKEFTAFNQSKGGKI